MWTLLVFFALSLGFSLALTPLVRTLSNQFGLTDKPDRRRKLHGQTIPVAGGIAVLLASLTTITLMLLADLSPWGAEFFEQAGQWLGMAAAAIVISCVGVVDDWGCLRGRHKLLGQILAVAILISTGLIVKTIHIVGL
jgi:UDP-GlcNAc:undecaprenyl-phosphate/decaprenyl-phosphate GlcNAc-1-phosphate transferase